MPELNVKGLIYATVVLLPVGILLFIGGVISIATKEVALGGVMMALGIASVGSCWTLGLVLRRRARAYNRELQAKQQADLGAAFRDYPGGRLP
jgi:hypothetical protein